MRRTLVAGASVSLALGLMTAPALAQGRNGNPLLDFQGKTSRYTPGLSCSAVPTTDGRTVALTTAVTSDSSKRTATVSYTIGGGPFNAIMPVATGKVMVVKGTQYLEGVGGTAERPGPPAHRRDTCSYAFPGGEGQAELVHLVPVTLPTADEIREWCSVQWWFEEFPQACPNPYWTR